MRLFQVQVLEHDKYIEKVKGMEKIVYSLTSPRGRVFDRNGVLLVDNEPVKVLRYGKLDNNSDYEKEIAFKLSEILNIDQNVIYKKMNNGYLSFSCCAHIGLYGNPENPVCSSPP